MRDWAISCIIASNAPGAGDFTPFPSERTLPIRDHKVSSNSDKFSKNFSCLDLRVGRPGGRSESDPSPRLRVSAAAKSRRFFVRRDVKKASDDDACPPL